MKVNYKPLNKHKISKRTGKNTVALVGFAMTSRDLAPWDDKDTEIWGINEAYKVQNFMKRWDRWFQLHSRKNFSRPDNPHDPAHYQWLQRAHDFPIYMQHHYDEIPSSVEYPLEEVIKYTSGLRYFTSTVAFMIGLAMLEGFERIELYGIEMASNTEYAYQRPNGEFMIGLALGKGVEIYLPPGNTMLSGSLYGYEKLGVGFRQQLETRLNLLRKDKLTAQKVAHNCEGAMLLLAENIKEGTPFNTVDAMQNTYAELETEMKKHLGLISSIAGQIAENEQIQKLYDSYPFEQDAGDFDYVTTKNS